MIRIFCYWWLNHNFLVFKANYDEMMKRYKELLTYIKSAVVRNYSERSINSILDYISTSKQVNLANPTRSILPLSHWDLEQFWKMDLLQNFYETTLLALKETKNDRLWFKTKLKLGKLYFDNGDYVKLARVLKELHKSCQVNQYNIFCSRLALRWLNFHFDSTDRWRRGWSEERHAAIRSICFRNPNVHGSKKQ